MNLRSFSILSIVVICFNFSCISQEKDLSEFVKEGYKIFDKSYGDLNKDGLEDCVLITKGTDKENITRKDYRGELDYNRRGIIILLGSEKGYSLVVTNYDCFSSENEYGGNYFAPELWTEVEKGNLIIGYGHGRYGHWRYIFRKNNSDFDLIGYESSGGINWVEYGQTSINFLTKKKLNRKNINVDAESGEEVFEETWEDIQVEDLIKLSEIEDFDNLQLL